MDIYISHVNVTQTVPDISPLMPMHQDPLLVNFLISFCVTHGKLVFLHNYVYVMRYIFCWSIIPPRKYLLGVAVAVIHSLFTYHLFHDDVIKLETFSAYWPFVRGIYRSPVNSLHKGQWRGALVFSLICIWINGWENSREAGDLGRYRAHYYVIVMC